MLTKVSYFFLFLVFGVTKEGVEDAFACKLVALIKTKAFDQAVEFLKQRKNEFNFERAYVLHRQGKNKEALVELEKVKDKTSDQFQQLKAQVVNSFPLLLFQTYKLNDYDSSIEIYCQMIGKGLEPEEVPDVAANLLACGANAPSKMQEIEKALQSVGSELEKTYEFVFNESLIQISNSQYNQALNSLLTSY